MSDPDGETVDFGGTFATASDNAPGAEPEVSGHAVHRAGHMEAPAVVAGEGERDGAVRPAVLRLREDGS